MSLWSGFTDILKNTISGFAGLNPGAIAQQAAPAFIPTQVVGGKVVTDQVRAGAQVGVEKSLAKVGVAPVDEASNKAFDPILQLGAAAEKYVFSPVIARPISTANLLLDPTSTLYKNGFQAADIKDAYNRSASVSLGQSMLKNPFSLIGMAESAILEANGVDVTGMDLWDDKDIQKNFVDNTLGRWITGTNDFVIKNAAIEAATFGAAGAIKAVGLRAGLTTKIKATDIEAMPKYEKDIYDHIDFIEGNGGTQTVIGQDIVDLAASDNILDIKRIVKKHSYNGDLPDLILNTKDPRVVADFLLADKGYAPAIDRLAALGRSDDMWVIGDATATFRGEYIKNGALPKHTPEQAARWNAAFDDAIKKDPKYQEIYDAFLSQELDDAGLLATGPKAQGKLYRPMEPKGFQGPAAVVRSKTGKLKTAITERDFTNPELGAVTQTVLGGGLKWPTTVLLRHTGTYMPKGIVTHSGLRPFDGIEELVTVFDDIPLFRDGTKVIRTHDMAEMTVSQYRRNLISKFTSAKTDGERALVIKNANLELAQTISYTRGFFDKQTIQNWVDELLNEVNSVHDSLRRQGYSMDPTGVRIKVDPKTQRQLANSSPMLPFGDFDRMVLRDARQRKGTIIGGATAVKQGTAASTKALFEGSSRVFSLAQLYRFSYVPKNSIFEPLLAATLAEGSAFWGPMFTQASKSAIKGTSNVILRGVSKSRTLLPSAKKEIQDEVEALSEQYNLAIINRDNVYSAYYSMFDNTVGVSPATKRDWADDIRGMLREAEKDVAAIESKLNTYTIDYGKPFDVPSVYNLRARIETLKAAGSVRYASEIRSAEITLQKAVGDINTLAPEINVIDADIAAAYARIGKALEELGPKNLEKARLFSVAEGRYAKKPILAETQKVILSNGQTLEFKNFASRNGFGEGYMSEIASNSTRTIEFLGNKATVGKITTVKSRSPKNTTYTSSPLYFDELSYVVNNHMRGDLLVDRILSGQSREEIIKDWSNTPQARYYMKEMGHSPDDIIRVIDEQISYVDRYLPTPEAKLAASQGAVGPETLRGLLGDKLNQMVPIQPLDIQYARPTSAIKSLGQASDTLLASAWKGLMKPENVIREIWGTSRHNVIIAEKAEALLAQGYTMDMASLNRIHHAAAVQVADEVASVFYTIPRQHRALYLARGLATFPNAAASGIYRYGRFAVKKTPRFNVFLNSYYSYYGSFGVDQYGNPVDDPMKAEYLLIPGTKELGLNKGKGVIVNARATNYVANFPGASWLVPIALSSIYGNKPNDEDQIKSAVNKTFGKIPGYSYEELFPYGIEQSTTNQLYNTFTPAWARNLRQFVSPDKTNKMFVDSWISEGNRQWAVYEMKKDADPTFKGTMPTPDSIMAGAKNIYLRKFRTQMFSILGSPQVVESRPDRMYQDIFYNYYNANIAKGQKADDAWKNAESKFQAQMLAENGAKFPIDRLFVSSQDSISYITPSAKAYNRIWEDFPGLATSLRQVDPSVVGLMVADLPKEYSPQVNRFLNSTTARLPDGTPVNSALKTPQLVEEEIEKSRFWAAYTAEKKRLNKFATDAEYASYLSVPELKDALKDYAVNSLGKASPVWFKEYDKGATTGNQAALQARGLYTVVNDEKFMNKFGKTQFWQHAKAFVTYRNQYAKAYADAPSGDGRGTKSYIAAEWQNYMASTLDMWDPTLRKMIDRYFENDNLRESR